MSVTQTTRLLSPEEIAVRAGEQAPFIRLPERASVFADRALRLRQLAADHAMRDFLVFVADLADAQHRQLAAMPAMRLPDAASLQAAARAGVAPLQAEGAALDPAWREVLTQLLVRLQPRLADSPAAAVAARLMQADAAFLDLQAERLLGGVMLGLDLAAAPLIAAALQVCWVHAVIEVDIRFGADRDAPLGRTDDPLACPCCASRPTASITRVGADDSGFRYLHCSLCATQWHMVRIKCTHCQSTKGIHYQSLQALPGHAVAVTAARPGAVQAETCDECGHYLKIVHMEKDVEVDPVADDLASLTLDLLVSDAGQIRHGVNLMLLFGDPEAGPDPGPDPGAG